MNQILFLLLLSAIVFIVAFLIGRHGFKNRFSLEKINQKRKVEKELAKVKILELFKTQKEIHNRDVENLLSVSDATATNYLDELEKEGKITQQGDKGKWVFYTKI